jgi:hypothetical protein
MQKLMSITDAAKKQLEVLSMFRVEIVFVKREPKIKIFSLKRSFSPGFVSTVY